MWLLAEAYLLTGRLDEARGLFAEASATAALMGNSDTIGICEARLAWLAMDRGEWAEAADRLGTALATIEQSRMHDFVFTIPAFAGAARLSVHRNDLNDAHRQLTARCGLACQPPTCCRTMPSGCGCSWPRSTSPSPIWDVHQLLREINGVLAHRPALGTLVEEVKDFRSVLASSAVAKPVGTLPLTPAELRLLPYLQTHLTADRIAERLFLSSHTVKTEIKAIYRKLGVSSRNDAVQRATAIGLLGT